MGLCPYERSPRGCLPKRGKFSIKGAEWARAFAVQSSSSSQISHVPVQNAMSTEYLEGIAMWQRSAKSTNFAERYPTCALSSIQIWTLALSFCSSVAQLLQLDGLPGQNPLFKIEPVPQVSPRPGPARKYRRDVGYQNLHKLYLRLIYPSRLSRWSGAHFASSTIFWSETSHMHQMVFTRVMGGSPDACSSGTLIEWAGSSGREVFESLFA